MAIGINWAEVWAPVWKPVWTQTLAAPVFAGPIPDIAETAAAMRKVYEEVLA